MKFKLSSRSMLQGRLTGISWCWKEWCLKLWCVQRTTMSEYEMALQYLLEEKKVTDTYAHSAKFEEVGPGCIRIESKVLTPVLMLAMWILKEFEPVPAERINTRWAEIMLTLGYKPQSVYAFPSVDQVTELYKKGGPEWKHLL